MSHSREAEAAVINDILLLGTNDLGIPVAWATLDELGLVPEDFYGGAQSPHGQIWKAILALRDEKSPIDVVIVGNRLGEAAKRALGNLPAQDMPENVQEHAEIVQEMSLRRRLSYTGKSIASRADNSAFPIAQLMTEAQQWLLGLNRDTRRSAMHASAIVPKVRKRIGGGSVHGPLTGILDWDAITGGLAPNQMSIIAARPGMGKSSLLAKIITSVAIKQQLGVVVFYRESGAVNLVQRIVQQMTAIPKRILESTDALSDRDQAAVESALAQIAAAPLYVCDSNSIDVHETLTIARQVAAQTPLALLAVDYVQLMVQGIAENENRELTHISNRLLGSAMPDDLDCHVMILSQLSRAVTLRADKRPKLHDLRGSGSLEQDASLVTFVYRPLADRKPKLEEKEQYRKGFQPCELLVKKHRDGEVGSVDALFHGPTTRFMNALKGEE